MLMPVGGAATTRGPEELIPQETGPALWKVQRKQREERLHRLSHVATKTHMQVEPPQPRVQKTTTKTSFVLADGTHEKRNDFFFF